jgi:uncharacterized membrane protein YgaE (UPF0421/DUF939 family)
VAVLTSIIVIQISVRESFNPAIDRLVVSIFGPLVGALATVLPRAHTPITLGLVLVGTITPLVLPTAHAAHYRIAPVTAFIAHSPIFDNIQRYIVIEIVILRSGQTTICS